MPNTYIGNNAQFTKQILSYDPIALKEVPLCFLCDELRCTVYFFTAILSISCLATKGHVTERVPPRPQVLGTVQGLGVPRGATPLRDMRGRGSAVV